MRSYYLLILFLVKVHRLRRLLAKSRLPLIKRLLYEGLLWSRPLRLRKYPELLLVLLALVVHDDLK